MGSSSSSPVNYISASEARLGPQRVIEEHNRRIRRWEAKIESLAQNNVRRSEKILMERIRTLSRSGSNYVKFYYYDEGEYLKYNTKNILGVEYHNDDHPIRVFHDEVFDPNDQTLARKYHRYLTTMSVFDSHIRPKLEEAGYTIDVMKRYRVIRIRWDTSRKDESPPPYTDI